MDAESKEGRPTVTVVFLAYNRRQELRLSLTKTLEELEYPPEALEVVVVDNASTDGTAAMLDSDLPEVRLIARSSNSGVSGFNDGFAVATGDFVLALDDDCHLPGNGLRRAVEEAERERADLVSFGVRSSLDPDFRFDIDEYRTGLFTFWGCAVLMRREVVKALGGYDPEIFVWANEVEFMIRFYDRGFRHLRLADVVAVHAKAPGDRAAPFRERPYRLNARNFGYTVGKLLSSRDAVAALVALLAQNVRDGIRDDRAAFKGLADTAQGFATGLRHRRPVRPEVSRTYRRNFEDFSTPWSMSRSLPELVRQAIGPSAPVGDLGRREEWRAARAHFYPERRGILEL